MASTTATTSTTTTTWLHLAGYSVLVAAVVFLAYNWVVNRDDLNRMKATIAQTEQARKTVVADVAQKVATIQKAHKAATTPVQQVQEVTKIAELPQPITVPAPTPTTPLPDAVVPHVDIQPLDNFAAECSECKVKLAGDEQQIKQLTTERDTAVQAAKGGSFWHRVKHNAKLIVISAAAGAAVGAIAASKK